MHTGITICKLEKYPDHAIVRFSYCVSRQNVLSDEGKSTFVDANDDSTRVCIMLCNVAIRLEKCQADNDVKCEMKRCNLTTII
jgi:hypothetical protein